MASTSTSGCKGKEKIMEPFGRLAPPAPSPASASKPTKKASYDVFINHRGPDVKSTLASALYEILTGMQVCVFLDDREIEFGGCIPQALEAAIRSAVVHIAIFSENYARSPWCLQELFLMVKSGATIIPIFYYVDPSDLRWVDQRKGRYAKAFEEYEEKGRYLERLQEWKKTLSALSYIKGEEIQDEKDEDRVLENIANIVKKTIQEIQNISSKVAKYPVGMEDVVRDFERNTMQSVDADQGAQIVGIWGMGGSGKTTLAKEFYKQRFSSFKGCSSIVFNVRDASTKGLLYNKQKEILRDFGFEKEEFYNVEDGKRILSRRLSYARVLIVLDDVDSTDQLDDLLIEKERLGIGSLIIVTTRERTVLKSWGISCIYKMKALDSLYAKQLFCWHAFEQAFSKDGFEELVEKFIKACHGLPLSLKVIGALLCRESDKRKWESLLHKIRRILPKDIQKILKISYDSLDYEEKEMFLDVACFFIGEEYTLPIELWDGLGRSGLHTWEILLNKCLVECDDENYIKMHDHIRDLGRSIASKQSPYRFWLQQPDIILQNQETRLGIRGIIATPNRVKWIPHVSSLGTERMPQMVRIAPEIDFRVCCSGEELMVNTSCSGILPLSPSSVGLKYLVISGDPFNQVIGKLSRELVWLRWFDIGQRKIPSGLSLKKLRVLELYEVDGHHLEELWGDSDGEASSGHFNHFKYVFQSFYVCFNHCISLLGNVSQVPVQLSELLISNCHKFQGFPKSIGHLKQLKHLLISSGNNITSLPDEFCFLQSLERLVVADSKMQSLSDNFGNLSNLRYLSLHGCKKLTRLPFSFKNLLRLEYLKLSFCSQLTFTTDVLERITSLELLDLSGCNELEELPCHIGNNLSLKELSFSYTSLRELPDNIGQLSRLKVLEIHNVLVTSLPISLGGLFSLMSLSIEYCPRLECLPKSLGGFSSLTSLSIKNCRHLECLPESIRGLSSLTSLSIETCLVLEHVPESLGDLSSLTELTIQYCPKLERHGVKSVLPKAIRQLSNLQELHLVGSPINGSSLSFGSSKFECVQLEETEVCRISFSEGYSDWLDILENHYLEEIEALPSTLMSIHLRNCEMLKNLPSFAELTSLGKFKLSGCNGIEKIEGIENCTQLTKLSADTCWEVPGIESLERLENLKKLKLRANKGIVIEHCIQMIQNWPDKIDIFAKAAPEAASLVASVQLPRNVVIVDAIANQKIKYRPKLLTGSSRDEAFMICLIINHRSSQIEVQPEPDIIMYSKVIRLHIRDQGRWAWVRVFRPRGYYSEILEAEELYICGEGEKLYICREDIFGEGGCGEEDAEEDEVEKGFYEEGGCAEEDAKEDTFEEDAEEDEVEKGFVLKEEKRALIEALRNLLLIY